jgi:hypothetical protein
MVGAAPVSALVSACPPPPSSGPGSPLEWHSAEPEQEEEEPMDDRPLH